MTRIQDMTATQRQSWVTLLADGAVFIWFWRKMTTGFSPFPNQYDIGEFGVIIVGMIILTIILHVIIAIVFEITGRNAGDGKDERDIAIERRGSTWGYRMYQIGVGVITVGVLMSAGFGAEYLSPLRFDTPVQIIFGLVVTSYVADLTKHAVMILGYGR